MRTQLPADTLDERGTGLGAAGLDDRLAGLHLGIQLRSESAIPDLAQEARMAARVSGPMTRGPRV